MATSKTVRKTKFTKTGTKTVTSRKSSVNRRDIQKQKIQAGKDIAMAKLNNDNYQKQITKRMAGAEAAAAIATPTTVALSNTDAFSSGGFEVNADNQSKDDNEETGSSKHDPNNIWG